MRQALGVDVSLILLFLFSLLFISYYYLFSFLLSVFLLLLLMRIYYCSLLEVLKLCFSVCTTEIILKIFTNILMSANIEI